MQMLLECVTQFSVDYITAIFAASGKRGVLHEDLMRCEDELLSYFSLPKSFHSTRLFLAVYYILLENYVENTPFPSGGDTPLSKEHYWKLANGIPDRLEFKDLVLSEHRKYLESNLDQLHL